MTVSACWYGDRAADIPLGVRVPTIFRGLRVHRLDTSAGQRAGIANRVPRSGSGDEDRSPLVEVTSPRRRPAAGDLHPTRHAPASR